MNTIVFGKPFPLYHRSAFHSPSPGLRLWENHLFHWPTSIDEPAQTADLGPGDAADGAQLSLPQQATDAHALGPWVGLVTRPEWASAEKLSDVGSERASKLGNESPQ